MQSVSGEFTTHTGQAVREPRMKVEVRWDGAAWTDESANVIGHSGEMGLDAGGLLLQGRVDEAEVTLWNTSRRYSADASGGDSAIRSHINGVTGMAGIQVRISQGFELAAGPSYVREFLGVIYKWRDGRAWVRLSLRSMAHVYLQVRASTAMVQNTNAPSWMSYLATTYLGLSTGDLVLDNSPFTIPWAFLDDDSVMEEIWDTAEADGGWARIDQWGKILFERASHWVHSPHDASVWTFDAGEAKTFDVALQPDWLASEVVVEYAPRQVNLSALLYQLDMPRTIPAGETLTFYVRLQQPAVGVYSVQDGDYWLMSSGGAVMNQNCTITLTPLAQRVKVEIANAHSAMAATLVWLQIRGIPLVGGPSQQVVAEAASWALDYDRVRSVRGNPLLQTEAQATALAAFMADRCENMQRLFTLGKVPGVPQLELGDRVTVSDGATVATGQEGFVIGIRWAANRVGYWQDLTVLDAEHLWPSDSYYVLGTTALGSGDAWY